MKKKLLKLSYVMGLVLLTSTITNAQKFKANSAYPNFSWDRVPLVLHLGKTSSLLSEEEAEFVASHTEIVVLEKGHALEQYGSTEEGIYMEAKRLKKLNPDLKVIFYWNSFLDYSSYDAHDTYARHPEWWLRYKNGKLDLKNEKIKRYDLSKPEVRKWWVDVAEKNVMNKYIDGIFLDAFPQVVAKANVELWGRKKYRDITEGLDLLITETRERLGDDKLIFYNGIRSIPGETIGEKYLKNTDGAMIEHFGHFNSDTKESMLADIDAMVKAGKQGKIIVFKGWPGYSWLDEDFMNLSRQEKYKTANENITFPLACFLLGAQKYSYFCYSWGYRSDTGMLLEYPELQKKPGRPIGDYVRDGWKFTREFENAKITVNLAKKEATINWLKE